MDRIAFVAKMHSGKTTCSNELVSAYGYQRLSFAAPVKEACVSMINAFYDYLGMYNRYMTVEQFECDKNQLRWLAQGVGTELGRQYVGPDSIWVDRLAETVELIAASTERNGLSAPRFVIDDCRFPNEVEKLRSLGFTIIRITRDESARITSIRSSLRGRINQIIQDAYADYLNEQDAELRVQKAYNFNCLNFDDLMSAELEKILSHPSETFVDELEADFSIANIEGDFDAVRDVLRHIAIAEGSLV
jgi:hypothetical protein